MRWKKKIVRIVDTIQSSNFYRCFHSLIPVLENSLGIGNVQPLQYSCWEIPWIEDPGGLQSKGLQRVRHD